MSLGLLLVSAAALPLETYDVCSRGVNGMVMRVSVGTCPNGTSCQGMPGDIGMGGTPPFYCIPDDFHPCRSDKGCDEGYCAAVALEDGECWRFRQCKVGNLRLGDPCQVDGDTSDCRRNGCGAGLVCQAEDPRQPAAFGRKAAALQSTFTCQPPARPLKAYDVCRSGGIETGPGVSRQDDCPKGTSCEGLPGDFAIGGEVTMYCIPDDVRLCHIDGECDEGYCAAVALEKCTHIRQCKVGNLRLGDPCQVEGDTFDCKRPGCGAGLVCQAEDPRQPAAFGRKAPALQSTFTCHPRPPPPVPLPKCIRDKCPEGWSCWGHVVVDGVAMRDCKPDRPIME